MTELEEFKSRVREDMRPKVSLKKIITRERMEEVRKLMDKGDGRSAAEKLADLNEALEKLERRITNKKQ
jgi:hypothetical protein